MYGSRISEMLNVQYRMHEDIMTWSSDELYGGNVTAYAGNAHHTLSELDVSTSRRVHTPYTTLRPFKLQC